MRRSLYENAAVFPCFLARELDSDILVFVIVDHSAQAKEYGSVFLLLGIVKPSHRRTFRADEDASVR